MTETTEQTFAEPVARGCGKSRIKGGAYWELGFSESGSPLERFLICPDTPIDREKLKINPRGVKLFEVNGTWHVLDWIGEMYYPNVTDFLEECRRFGVSRRVELPKSGYAKLTPDSRLIAAHPAGFILNADVYWGARIGRDSNFFHDHSWKYCPTGKSGHDMSREKVLLKMRDEKYNSPMCAGLWWEDCLFTEPIEKGSRLGFRTMPSFRYRCASPPNGTRSQAPAFVASFPLGRIVVIEDPEGQTHLEKMEKIELDERLQVAIVEA